MWDKNTSARLCAKNAGGAYARGGVYLRDTTVLVSVSKLRVQVHVTQYYRQPCMYLHSLVFMA